MLGADVGNGHAARSMARLAVDQRQTGFCRNLVTMYREFESPADAVVSVALFATVLVSGIIRFEVGDQKEFVILDG